MSAALVFALFFTVALLVTTAYFLLGSLPLLVLEHDTPMDSHFVLGFFNTYYLAAMVTATATAVSYLFVGRLLVSAGATALAALAAVLRWKLVPAMEALRGGIQDDAEGAISAFRRVHLIAIVISLFQLVLIVWSLIAVSVKAGASG